MTVHLSEKAPEGGTYIIQTDFNEVAPDGSKTPFVPKAGLTWSLYDKDGAIINERNAVGINPLATVYIPLSGADLALPSAGNIVRRYVIVKGTYDSAFGDDLPVVREASFQIEPAVGQPGVAPP